MERPEEQQHQHQQRQEPGGGGPPRCSFCGRTTRERSFMHAGPGWARICNGCVYDAKTQRGNGPGKPRRCGFCGTERDRVEWIFGGSMVSICNVCIEDCVAEMAGV